MNRDRRLYTEKESHCWTNLNRHGMLYYTRRLQALRNRDSDWASGRPFGMRTALAGWRHMDSLSLVIQSDRDLVMVEACTGDG